MMRYLTFLVGLNLMAQSAPAQQVLTNQFTIGGWEYQYRFDLTNVIIRSGVTNIGQHAFASCFNLTNISIPNSVTHIGSYAFSYYCGLQNAAIPDSVTSIDDFAFYGCTNLTRITVGKGLTTAGAGALAPTVADLSHGFPLSTPVAICFMGDAPTNFSPYVFCSPVSFGGGGGWLSCNVTVYARPGTTGWVNPTNWDSTLAGRPVWYASIVYQPYASPAVYWDGPLLFFQLVARGPITMTNLPIVLEACSDLTKPVWTRLATNTMFLADTPSGGYGNCARSFHDLVTKEARFYRIRAETIDWP
jgi:hypothetical protein